MSDTPIDVLTRDQAAKMGTTKPDKKKGRGGTNKGTFTPANKEKYKGNPSKITYRSSWEAHLMKWCDRSPQVKRWNSEEIVIPYFSNADGRRRRYFMDFYVEFTDGSIHLWEVKPFKETQQPKTPSQLTAKTKARFIEERHTFSVNIDKWTAAYKICQKKGWQFKIITEKTLPKFGWKDKPKWRERK